MTYKSVFIPCLLYNDVISYSNKRLGVINKKFIVNSVDFDLMDGSFMNLGVTSLEEVAIC